MCRQERYWPSFGAMFGANLEQSILLIIQHELGMGSNGRGIGLQRLRREFLQLTDAE
jgi:hypothetical protein